MNAPHQEPRVEEYPHYGFVIGLAAGTIVGAGLALWLGSRMASELRQRATDSARHLGQQVSDQYHRASDRVGEAVEDLSRKTDEVRDGVADAVVRGAQEVERLAVAGRSDHRR
jgi:gas vesicle protein